MDCHVSVILKTGEKQDFHLTESELAMFSVGSAQEWLAREYDKAGCEAVSPVGKVLLVDRILQLGALQPAAGWTAPSTWIRQYLCASARAMGRPALTIDLAHYAI